MERNLFCPTCQKQVPVQASHTGRVPCPSCGAELDVSHACEVFISYASADLEKARQLAAALQADGISHWLAPSQIGPGEAFDDEIYKALACARVLILILSAAASRSTWVKTELVEAKKQGLWLLPLVTEEFDIPPTIEMDLNRSQKTEAFRQPFERYIGIVLTQVKEFLFPETITPEAAPIGVDPKAKPYVGLEPFSPLYADRFFGRERETKELLKLIVDSRVVLLHAPSGAGKSSLLNTLITQKLERMGIQVLPPVRVGGALPKTIEAGAIGNIYTFAAIYGIDATIASDPQCSLDDYLASLDHKPGTLGRVLIFDQFEEFFTQHEDRREDRTRFFDEFIVALKHDPKLSLVLSMRKEWLADILPLADRLPTDLSMQRFALDPLREEGAKAAITLPVSRYATFAPGVAESIVQQLSTIKVKGFDGVEVTKRSEFVEMVHLQIVCQRLWRSLPPGVECIEKDHVERAAGEGKMFSEFVVNALDEFYEETVKKVAKESGYSEELIRLGCMEFVTAASTRTLVHRGHGRTGRLPDWIIDQLHSEHLLRAEKRGNDSWYELSHDQLAETVGRERDSNISKLLYATDLLNKMMEKAQDENGQTLKGYFGEHHDILKECKPFHTRVGLFPDEEEFVFRASLVTGEDMSEWSRRLDKDCPKPPKKEASLREVILQDAVQAESAAVRNNAAGLLGFEPVAGLMQELVRLALSDTNASVRRAAAVSLARLDEPELYAEIVKKLQDAATATDAQTALSNIRVAVDQKLAVEEKLKNPKDPEVPAPRFEPCFRSLTWSIRARILLEGWGYRFEEGLPWFPVIVIPAAVLAAISAAAFKWLPGILGWSLEQRAASPGMGIFHGLSGGVIWGGSIALGLTMYYIVIERQQDKKSFWRPFGAILTGAVFGFLSSSLIVLVVVLVFETESLVGMGWISNQGHAHIADVSRFDRQFWRDLFVELRYGWIQHIIGTGMGIGMALSTNSLRAWNRWNQFLRQQRSVKGWKQSARLIRDIMPIAMKQVWPIPLMIIIAAVGAVFVPKPQAPEEAIRAIENNMSNLKTDKEKRDAIETVVLQREALKEDHRKNEPLGFFATDHKAASNSSNVRWIQLIHGLIADGASQIIGAYFAIVGMGFGIVIVRRGVQLEPWKN